MKDKTVLGLDFGSDCAQVFAVGLADGTEFASAVCRKSRGAAGRLSRRQGRSMIGRGVDSMSPAPTPIAEITIDVTPRPDFAENREAISELRRIHARIAKATLKRCHRDQSRIAATSSAGLIRPSNCVPGFCISGTTWDTVGRSGFLNNMNRVRCVQVKPLHTAGNNEGAK